MPPSDRHERDAANEARSAFAVPQAHHGQRRSYQVREPLLPLGDDYVIELAHGGLVFRVDGRMLRLQESLTITDAHDAEVLQIHGTLLDARNVLTIVRDGVTVVATVRKLADDPAGGAFAIELPGEEHVGLLGRPAERAYQLTYRDAVVAVVSRARRPFHPGYDVQIAPEQDDVVVLAVTVCLDAMSRP